MGYLETKVNRVRRDRPAPADMTEATALLQGHCRSLPAPPSFGAALRAGDTVTLIAEFKRRSPSAGALATSDDLIGTVRRYHEAGARALSVLTDAEDFGGTIDDLAGVVEHVPLPVLRKDFLVDELGIYESRNCGAAAVLLIVRILEASEVAHLLGVCRQLNLTALVEVHDEEELEIALAAGAGVIGINNRDLERLTTDLSVTARLAGRIPNGITVVSESGIRSADDVRRVRDAGAHAVLVGEALLRVPADARPAVVTQLAEVPR